MTYPKCLLTLVLGCVGSVATSASAEPPNDKMLTALQPFHEFVGVWAGGGTSEKSSGWKEQLVCTWGFRESDGRVSLNFYVNDAEMLQQSIITYDPEASQYRMVIKTPKGKMLQFAGEATSENALALNRVGKSTDDLDQIELKVVRSGKKLIYTFKRKRGSSYFEPVANIEHFREGTPQAEFEKGPRCLVTGGAGRVPVEYEGKTYHLACSASREEFLRRPEVYLKPTQN